MNPNKALWEKGDFTRIAASMRESGEALVQAIGIREGLCLLRGSAPECWASTSPATWSRAETGERRRRA